MINCLLKYKISIINCLVDRAISRLEHKFYNKNLKLVTSSNNSFSLQLIFKKYTLKKLLLPSYRNSTNYIALIQTQYASSHDICKYIKMPCDSVLERRKNF